MNENEIPDPPEGEPYDGEPYDGEPYDVELLLLAALTLRWAHAMVDDDAQRKLTRKELADVRVRVREMTKLAHDEILTAHPEFEDVLPRGGIRALMHS